MTFKEQVMSAVRAAVGDVVKNDTAWGCTKINPGVDLIYSWLKSAKEPEKKEYVEATFSIYPKFCTVEELSVLENVAGALLDFDNDIHTLLKVSDYVEEDEDEQEQ